MPLGDLALADYSYVFDLSVDGHTAQFKLENLTTLDTMKTFIKIADLHESKTQKMKKKS